ncbi:MAG: hypothetical protein ABIS45_18580 [Burkholderiales bacterium]
MCRRIFLCFVAGLLLAGCISSVGPPPSTPLGAIVAQRPAPPQIGETAVYRVVNAYNGEPRGDVQYRVEKVENERVFVAVTTSSPYAGLPHNEIYTPDGNWLRHPVSNHDQAIEYEFIPPFPAREFPLEPGKAWSARVNARNLATGRGVSVRVDAQVLGSERITVAAGSFDVVKIRRTIYAGDFDGFLRETTISELDWYAPSIRRSVRTESNSTWIDTSRGGGGFFGGAYNNQIMRGDWNVVELVSMQRAGNGAP